MDFWFFGVIKENAEGYATALFRLRIPLITEEDLYKLLADLNDETNAFLKKLIIEKGFPIAEDDQIKRSDINYEIVDNTRFALFDIELTFKKGTYKKIEDISNL